MRGENTRCLLSVQSENLGSGGWKLKWMVHFFVKPAAKFDALVYDYTCRVMARPSYYAVVVASDIGGSAESEEEIELLSFLLTLIVNRSNLTEQRL